MNKRLSILNSRLKTVSFRRHCSTEFLLTVLLLRSFDNCFLILCKWTIFFSLAALKTVVFNPRHASDYPETEIVSIDLWQGQILVFFNFSRWFQGDPKCDHGWRFWLFFLSLLFCDSTLMCFGVSHFSLLCCALSGSFNLKN